MSPNNLPFLLMPTAGREDEKRGFFWHRFLFRFSKGNDAALKWIFFEKDPHSLESSPDDVSSSYLPCTLLSP